MLIINWLLWKKQISINVQLDSALKQQVKDNRSKLLPIIETIIFCGTQGIPLREHKNYGPLELDEPIDNDGNLRALLRLRIKCGDINLKKHFNSSSQHIFNIIY